MDRTLTAIGFDADDTLWHHATYYRLTQEQFASLLADDAPPDLLFDRRLEAERRKLGHYAFDVKGVTLSMIETAIEVTEGRVPAAVIGELLVAGRQMLEHPIELLPQARTAVEALAGRHPLILVTKGDLLDQERNLAQSGLGDLFDAVEVVSDKTPTVYAWIFARPGTGAGSGLMVGNSLRSDVLPMIEAGGWGVHVPHEVVWALDHAEAPQSHPRFRRLENPGELPALVSALGGGSPHLAELRPPAGQILPTAVCEEPRETH